MKTATTICPVSKKEYAFLILENSWDLLNYALVRYDVAASEAADFLFAFRGQTYYQNPSDFLVHEYSSKQITGNKVMAAQILKKESVTNIHQFSEAVSALNTRLTQGMQKVLNRGQKVRVNIKGAYCSISDLNEHQNIQTISTEEMKKFIYNPPEPKELQVEPKIEVKEEAPPGKWYSGYEKLGPHMFTFDKYVGEVSIPIHEEYDFQKKKFRDSHREVIGYCDASQIVFRPKANTIVLLAWDKRTGEEFWFHIGE